MDDAAISDLLKCAAVPDGSAARLRTEELAGEAVRSHPRRRWVAVASVVAAVLLALTPPVQSLAEDVAELVGIGDAPSDDFAGQRDEVEGQGVIAVGTTPSGEPVELVVTSERGPQTHGQSVICRFVSFPSASIKPIGQSCQSPQNLISGETVKPFATIGPDELGSEQDLIVEVRSTAPAATVSVTYNVDGEEQDAELISGTFTLPELAEGLGGPDSDTPVTLGVAFLPSTILGAPDPYEGVPDSLDAEQKAEALAEYERTKAGLRNIVVSAADDNGEEIYRSRLSDLPMNLASSLAWQR